MAPIKPSDYRDHRPLALAVGNLWENNGWMVWSRSGADDVLLWLSPYRLRGGEPAGPYALGDVALSQTLFMSAPTAAAHDGMRDDRFLVAGYDLGDHLPADALQVQVTDTDATWAIGRRQFVARPPHWRIRGSHAGVDVDIEISSAGPPLWLADPAASVEDTDERWFTVCATAKGWVRTDGRTFPIDGYASHERHVHCGVKYNPVSTLSARGVTWHSGSDGANHLIFLSRPSRGSAWCQLLVDGTPHDFSAPHHRFAIEETAFWIDPQSRIQIPCAWNCEFSGPAGELHVSARASRRAYYLWPHFAHGCTVLYWWLATARIRARLSNGREIEMNDVQYIVHDNRLLYRSHRHD